MKAEHDMERLHFVKTILGIVAVIAFVTLLEGFWFDHMFVRVPFSSALSHQNETLEDPIKTSRVLGLSFDNIDSGSTRESLNASVSDSPHSAPHGSLVLAVQSEVSTPNSNETLSKDMTSPERSLQAPHSGCVTPEIVGSWKYEGAAMRQLHTSAICCDIESTYPEEHEFCDRNASKDRLEFHGHERFMAFMGGRGCSRQCQKYFRDAYRWNSENVPDWNATEFCELLNNRRVLMIGDSTMSQAATTLMNAVHGVCQKQMSFFLSDTLLNRSFGNLNRGEHWLKLVEHNAHGSDDIILLTAGGHVLKQKDLHYVSDTVISQIVELRKQRPGLQVVYKTLQPGGCTKRIVDVSLAPWEAGRLAPARLAKYGYNYQFFYGQDERTIRNLQHNNIPFLDMRMLYSRSDAHPYSRGKGRSTDCLHMCSPGPLDVFPILFLRLLQNDLAVPQCL